LTNRESSSGTALILKVLESLWKQTIETIIIVATTFKILLLHAALFVVTLVEGQARESTVRDQIELQIKANVIIITFSNAQWH